MASSVSSERAFSTVFPPFYWVLKKEKKGKEIEKKEMEGISQHRFPWLPSRLEGAQHC